MVMIVCGCSRDMIWHRRIIANLVNVCITTMSQNISERIRERLSSGRLCVMGSALFSVTSIRFISLSRMFSYFLYLNHTLLFLFWIITKSGSLKLYYESCVLSDRKLDPYQNLWWNYKNTYQNGLFMKQYSQSWYFMMIYCKKKC